MADSFPTLIGKVIHHCGALEFLTNGAIKTLSTDVLLSGEISKLSFARRIEILRVLLRERTELSKASSKQLCDLLSEIARRRNEVAHNPIMTGGPDASAAERIVVVRHQGGKADVKKEISQDDLRNLVTNTREAIELFLKLLPSSTHV